MFWFRNIEWSGVLALGLLAACRADSSAALTAQMGSTGSPTVSSSDASSSQGSGLGSSEGSSSGSTTGLGGTEAGDSSSTGGACDIASEPLPAEVLPRCAAETLTCLETCGEDDLDCIDGCFQDDPTSVDPFTGIDCETCSLLQLLACSEPACHDANAAFLCCNAACEGQDCAADACAAELTAAFECAVFSAAPCLEANTAGVDGCFPADDRDAR